MTTPEPAKPTPAERILTSLQHAAIARDTLDSLRHRLDDTLAELHHAEQVVADRLLNDFLRVAHEAREAGVAPAVFQAAKDSLTAATARLQAVGNGTGPQQAAQDAPGTPETDRDGTGGTDGTPGDAAPAASGATEAGI